MSESSSHTRHFQKRKVEKSTNKRAKGRLAAQFAFVALLCHFAVVFCFHLPCLSCRRLPVEHKAHKYKRTFTHTMSGKRGKVCWFDCEGGSVPVPLAFVGYVQTRAMMIVGGGAKWCKLLLLLLVLLLLVLLLLLLLLFLPLLLVLLLLLLLVLLLTFCVCIGLGAECDSIASRKC